MQYALSFPLNLCSRVLTFFVSFWFILPERTVPFLSLQFAINEEWFIKVSFFLKSPSNDEKLYNNLRLVRLMSNQKLVKLRKARICDQDTVERLSIGNEVIDGLVERLHTYYQGKVKAVKKVAGDLDGDNYKQRMKTSIGTAVLFLETLLEESESVKTQVSDWLQDEKRFILFCESGQGDTYGELLVAKAKNALVEYNKKYNKGIPAQSEFVYDKEFKVDTKGMSKSELLETKLNAILAKMNEDLIGEVKREFEKLVAVLEKEFFPVEFLDPNFNIVAQQSIMQRVQEPIFEVLEYLVIQTDYSRDISLVNDVDMHLLGYDNNPFFYHIISELSDIMHGSFKKKRYSQEKIKREVRSELDRISQNLNNWFKVSSIAPHIDELVNALDSADSDGWSNAVKSFISAINNDGCGVLSRETISELESLAGLFGQDDLSEKLRRPCSLSYSL